MDETKLQKIKDEKLWKGPNLLNIGLDVQTHVFNNDALIIKEDKKMVCMKTESRDQKANSKFSNSSNKVKERPAMLTSLNRSSENNWYFEGTYNGFTSPQVHLNNKNASELRQSISLTSRNRNSKIKASEHSSVTTMVQTKSHLGQKSQQKQSNNAN